MIAAILHLIISLVFGSAVGRELAHEKYGWAIFYAIGLFSNVTIIVMNLT